MLCPSGNAAGQPRCRKRKRNSLRSGVAVGGSNAAHLLVGLEELVKVVTPADMAHVDIKPGWVIRQFIKQTFSAGESPDHADDEGAWIELLIGLGLSSELISSLLEFDALVYQKNQQYKDAWQKDGPVTALCDLKDKLYRLDSASESGAVLRWDKDKLLGTFFDIWVRDMMCLAWFGLNFVEEDDDRRDK